MPMNRGGDDPVVEVRAAGVSIGGRPIVRDVSLSVRRGEVVAVLGANGSGKSTLVKAMLGLAPLASGEALLFGTPVPRFRSWRKVGYVPQRSTIAQGVPATVTEVVASGRLAHRRPFAPQRAADRAAVRAALDAVGMRDRARQSVHTLSGGQQQRVLMARTLAVEPELLVLDEPNAGVDLASQDAIAATLAQRSRAGSTIVVVLHELGPFASMIDRTVRIRQGRVVYDGPPHGGGLEDVHDHHLPSPVPPGVPPLRSPLEGGH